MFKSTIFRIGFWALFGAHAVFSSAYPLKDIRFLKFNSDVFVDFSQEGQVSVFQQSDSHPKELFTWQGTFYSIENFNLENIRSTPDGYEIYESSETWHAFLAQSSMTREDYLIEVSRTGEVTILPVGRILKRYLSRNARLSNWDYVKLLKRPLGDPTEFYLVEGAFGHTLHTVLLGRHPEHGLFFYDIFPTSLESLSSEQLTYMRSTGGIHFMGKTYPNVLTQPRSFCLLAKDPVTSGKTLEIAPAPPQETLRDHLMGVFVKDQEGRQVSAYELIQSFSTELTAENLAKETTVERPGDHFEAIRRALLKKSSGSIAITGEPGGGKSTYVKSFLKALKAGKFLELSPETIVLHTSASRLEAGTIYKGSLETSVQALIAASERVRIVLFVDEVHTLSGAGTHSESSIDIFEHLKEPMASGRLKIIGTTTNGEYRRYISGNAALSRRMPEHELEPIPREELVGALEKYAEATGLKVLNPSDTNTIIDLAIEYAPVGADLSKSIDLYEEVLAALQVAEIPVADLNTKFIHRIAAEKYRIDHAYFNSKERTELIHSFPKSLDALYAGQSSLKKKLFEDFRAILAKVNDRSRPGGRYLLTGTEGAGKSYLAECYAKASKRQLVKFNVADFSGYDGTERFLQKLGDSLESCPSCVLFFDEIEKATPDLQVALFEFLSSPSVSLPKASRPGSKSVIVNYHNIKTNNTVVFLATNAGSGYLRAQLEPRTNIGFALDEKQSSGESNRIDEGELKAAILAESHLSRPFLDRLQVLPVLPPASSQELERNLRLQIELRAAQRIKNSGLNISISSQEKSRLAKHLANKFFGSTLSLRPPLEELDRILEQSLVDLFYTSKTKPSSRIKQQSKCENALVLSFRNLRRGS